MPKGPSLDPKTKRLAVEVEDHPLEYGQFEGTIPAGQYGAGQVRLWDSGTWTPEGDAHAGLARGHLKFRLDGGKLKGGWILVRMPPKESEAKHNWLLIKEADEHAGRACAADTLPRREQDAYRPRTARGTSHAQIKAPAAQVRRRSGANRKTKIDPAAATVADVTITHPQRVFDDSGDLTKLDLARYYEAVSDWLRPHLASRPLAVLRCPGGDFGACFLQRHANSGLEGEKSVLRSADYVLADSSEGVVEMVQAGVIEFHTWGVRVPRIERPDRITLDLDPDPGLNVRCRNQATE